MQPSTQPLLATSATSNREVVGPGIGAVWRPRLVWAVCGRCRLKAAFPDRGWRPRPAWLVCAGEAGAKAGLAPAAGSADAPACGQAVGANLAPANLDFGRARWMRGNAEWMNGKAKDLNGRNTFFICDTVNADWDQRKILAYLRLMGKKCLRAATGRCGGRKVDGSLLREESADGLQFLAARLVGFGIAQTQFFQGVEDDPGNDQARVRFVIGRNDIPGRVRRAGGAEARLIGLHVILPKPSFFDIGEADFPVLFRGIDAFEEAFALFFFREVEEELDDPGPVAVEMVLQVHDGPIALPPQALPVERFFRQFLALESLRMDANDEDFLVIRAIKDADPAAFVQAAGGSPKEIVLQLLGARMFETEDLAALGIDAGHHVLDGAVFSRRIHGLKNQQHRIAHVGVEEALQLAQFRLMFFEKFLILILRFVEAVHAGGPLFECDLFTGPNAKIFGMNLHNGFALTHASLGRASITRPGRFCPEKGPAQTHLFLRRGEKAGTIRPHEHQTSYHRDPHGIRLPLWKRLPYSRPLAEVRLHGHGVTLANRSGDERSVRVDAQRPTAHGGHLRRPLGDGLRRAWRREVRLCVRPPYGAV